MSSLAIYNTLTRRKEPFVPLVPGKAGLYVCGPTVYDYIHVGNARTFTVFDLVVRWLRASGLRGHATCATSRTSTTRSWSAPRSGASRSRR